MTLAQRSWAELDYVEILFGVIIAWVLIALWQRVIENVAYTTLRLNPKSAFHALLVAIVVTAIFLVLITSVDSISEGILVGSTTSAPAPANKISNSAAFDQAQVSNMTSSQNKNLSKRNDPTRRSRLRSVASA